MLLFARNALINFGSDWGFLGLTGTKSITHRTRLGYQVVVGEEGENSF